MAERRGDKCSALAHLEEAYELHKRAFGEAAHVNKAAVLSQLANLSLQEGEPGRADSYLQVRRYHGLHSRALCCLFSARFYS